MMVSLVKGLAASLYAVVHSVPYQYQSGMGSRPAGSRPRPRPWVIIKVEAKDGREQNVVTMT